MYFGRSKGVDEVISLLNDGSEKTDLFEKTRPDDFIEELLHINDDLSKPSNNSPISLTRGLETMLVIAASYKSAVCSTTVEIDYSKGFTAAALGSR